MWGVSDLPAWQETDAYRPNPSGSPRNVFLDGRLAAIVSLHQLGTPRTWSEDERALAHEAAERVRALLEA